jgi:hypothetical protein
LEPATLSNPTKGQGAKCIPIAYHRLNLRLLARVLNLQKRGNIFYMASF